MVINATVNKAPEKQTLPAFTHRPDHDGESIFWTLLHSFVEALPLNGRLEPSPGGMVQDLLLSHSIEGSVAVEEGIQDKRDGILPWYDSAFDGSLHPDLRGHGIGSLLERMAKQVQPEYAWLEPNPRVDHLHEAFRRLLLEFIVALEAKGDIPLDAERVRNLSPPEIGRAHV